MLASRKLTQKFTVIIFLIVYIPIFILTSVLLRNTQETLIREKMNSVYLDVEQMNTRIQKTVEVSEILTQTFASNASLIDYIQRAQRGENLSAEETLRFYRHEIATLSKFTYANAYVYQIRVYAESDTIPEMMPVLYRLSRMERLSWARTPQPLSTWHFDYTDTLFPDHVSPRKTHLMGYAQPFLDQNGVSLGVIEVAVEMEALLPGLFQATDQTFLCLMDDAGNRYYDRSGANPWLGMLDEITEQLTTDTGNLHQRVRIGDQEVILSTLSLPKLGASLVQVTSLQHEISTISSQRWVFYTAMVAGMAVLIVLISWTVKALLRRFNNMSANIQLVQQGDLSVRMPENGGDEVAEMGKQINLMLDTINVLIAENTEREVIVKNTEIRALHNQINAHFIYNVLESIKMMAEINEHYQIADAVTSLGKLLRYSMRWTSRNVSIEEEIEYIQNYLSLTNLRFDHQIRLSLSIADPLLKQAIPKISLQPIVENAIGHGLVEALEDTYIYIKAYAEDGQCIIEITDPGKGIDEDTLMLLRQKIDGAVEASGGGSGHGIGLKNVQDRIRVTFGESYGLTVQSSVGMYTKVVVTLPLLSITEE